MKAKICLNGHTIDLNNFPDKCPICNHIEYPDIIYSEISDTLVTCEGDKCNKVISICHCRECSDIYAVSFVLKYKELHYKELHFIATNCTTLPANSYPQDGIQALNNISPSFVRIYNQSIVAKNTGLYDLVGMGLRKALEFLIKDYSIYIHPECENDIKSKPLSQCIEKYIDYDKIKTVAKRASWLGNDQTHYIQKFSDHDVDDLIQLIKLTVYWINSEIETSNWALLDPRK